jgi:hypothetical protein
MLSPPPPFIMLTHSSCDSAATVSESFSLSWSSQDTVSQIHPYMCFANLLLTSQSNQVDIRINYHSYQTFSFVVSTFCLYVRNFSLAWSHEDIFCISIYFFALYLKLSSYLVWWRYINDRRCFGLWVCTGLKRPTQSIVIHVKCHQNETKR